MEDFEKDDRFSKVTYDPRFLEKSKKRKKIVSDDRFKNFKHSKDKLNNKSTVSEDDFQEKSLLEDNVHISQSIEKIYDEITYSKEPTNRLAILNLDWTYIRAVDIFAILQTFLPAHKVIMSVNIYPTKYGNKCMEDESKHGPLIHKNFKENSEKEKHNNIVETNIDDIKNYEINTMKYYIAEVICDNINTAQLLYEECNGYEIEHTSNVMDIRYIPNNENFDEFEAKDKSSEMPIDYQAPKLYTKSIQQTKVKLSWDQTNPHRKNLLNKKFTKDDIKNDNFNTYIYSEQSDISGSEFIISESEDGNQCRNYLKKKKRNKYAELLSKLNKDTKKDKPKDSLTITFKSGFDDNNQKSSKKEKDEVKQKENLELLMLNDDNQSEFNEKEYGFDFNDYIIRSKKKLKVEDNFKIDESDKRFEALYTNAEYNIDTSHKLFKKTRAMIDFLKIQGTNSKKLIKEKIFSK